MDPIDLNNPMPLYHQLKQALSAEIRAGLYPKNQPIPPERELTKKYGVSRITVRQALSELVMEGLLYKKQGKGTYVSPAPPISETLSSLTGHVEELHLRGWEPSVEILQMGARIPNPDIALALELEEEREAFVVVRLIKLNEAPLLFTEAWLPVELGARLIKEALYKASIIKQFDILDVPPARGRQRIRAASATGIEAEHLGVPIGSAVLEVTRTIYSTRNNPIEWSRSIYNSEKYEYMVELRR